MNGYDDSAQTAEPYRVSPRQQNDDVTEMEEIPVTSYVKPPGEQGIVRVDIHGHPRGKCFVKKIFYSCFY